MDRDGVVNQLLYFAEQGRIDTPLNPQQFQLIPGVGQGIKILSSAGFQIVIVSNQPGIAKGQLSRGTFESIRQETRHQLEAEGALLDGEYYCLHHPQAVVSEYRKICDCRKPKPGLILQAAGERSLDIESSFMVGDGLTDVEAGNKAGCHTILVAHLSSLLTETMERKQIHPTYLAEDFSEAVRLILGHKSAIGVERL